jgi:hypothetical protein|tara:strand:+ start:346 stop:582 length:237 start_codon:yes stop_codon:yes gene_type:complete
MIKLDSDMMMTKSRFTRMVEDWVREKQQPYMDAVVAICENHNMDVEDCKKFVSPVIKNKLEAEAMSLNYLPRQNTLPL